MAARRNRRIRKTLNAAKTHWLYSQTEVMTLYGVCRNTVLNWTKAGLRQIEAEECLFRGCDLNEFQRVRREKAKRRGEPHEIFCIRCKTLHSLLVEPFKVLTSRLGCHVELICPDTGQSIRKFVGQADIDDLLKPDLSRQRAESQNYTASPACTGFGQNGLFLPDDIIPEDEHTIYCYQRALIHTEGRHEKTVDASLRAIRLFQSYLAGTRLSETTIAQVTAFKTAFEEGAFRREQQNASGTDADRQMLSSSTIVHCFGNLEAFFNWLRDRPGYRKIPADIPSHFRPSRHHRKVAGAPTEKHVPSHEDLLTLIRAMPDARWRDRRDRALVAFLYLSGMRDGAVIGLRLKQVDVERREILQDPREIRTKNSKTMRSSWFPVGEEFAGIVTGWIGELRQAGAQDEDPLFPQTRPTFGQRDPREPWVTATPLRKIVKAAIQRSGQQPFRPHAIRATLARLGYRIALTMEEQKAWSQNLGHDHLATTAIYYGKLDTDTQARLMSTMWNRGPATTERELIDLIRVASPEKLQAIRVLLRG